MKNIDSQVITHIEEAKNWLDEAKEEYIQSNGIRGDLNLNLAQAEVKCAWELSRNQNVKHIIQPVPNQPAGRSNYYLPAAAVSVLILSFLCAGLYLGTGMLKPKPAAKADNIKPIRLNPVQIAALDRPENQVVADDSARAIERSKSVSNQPQNVPEEKRDLPAAVERNSKPKPSPRVIAAAEPKAIPAIPEKSSVSVSRNHNNVKAIAQVSAVEPAVIPEVKSEPEQPRDAAQIRTKPVLVPLLIDEEALTKEASYSLRNGK
jgi:hypothetical protein